MIDASGDIAVSEPPPGENGWRIALTPLGGSGDEVPVILLSHAAVTTSGDAYQAAEIDGRRYSHIVDPRTGLGVPGPAAVTVIARDCATADALATAASVLGPERGLEILDGFPGSSGHFVWQDNDSRRTASSAGWPAP
jgi:thiamine biosynthesis lipoprotein